jgi:hypothetical protein
MAWLDAQHESPTWSAAKGNVQPDDQARKTLQSIGQRDGEALIFLRFRALPCLQHSRHIA